jgi:hypothetical protein
MIGQEDLPLESEVAVREAAVPVATDIGVSARGLQPWTAVVLAGSDQPHPPALSACRPEAQKPARQVPPATPSESPVAPRVLIESAVVPPARGRPRREETYPFDRLTPVSADGNGELSGNCIFIPDADEPRKHIANARKRYRDRVFITRTTSGGKMIWRLR